MSGIGVRMPLLLLVLLWGLGPRVAAAAPTEATVRIDLITVGPGDALLTRAGHVALMVTETLPDGRELSRGYNYGDTDFSDASVPLRFLFGELTFFLAATGDLYDTTEHYGLLQDRDVYRQRLALSEAQARSVAEHLAAQVLPEHREYRYHYLEATCSTRARDVLDEATGGALREQLEAQLDPWTVRDFQQLTFAGDPVLGLVGDLMFGRMHDRPISRYYALMWPERMRTALMEVRVPDPAGGAGLVALAGPPEQLAARGGPPISGQRNPITWIVAPLVLAWALLGGWWVARRGRSRPRLAAAWLVSWSLPAGLVGAAIVVLQLGSSVPQLRSNELMASLLVSDLLLVGLAWRWWRRRALVCPRWLPSYAVVRLVVVGAAVGARALGPLIQQPWIVPLASLGCGLALLGVVRALRGGVSEREPPASATTGASARATAP